MGSILVLMGLFLRILTSGRTVAGASTDISDWGEKGDIWKWNVEDIPNPQTRPKFCQRYTPSNVCNPDSVLTKEEADDLDSAIQRVYNGTACVCPGCSSSYGGIIIGIAVMKHIFLPFNEHRSAIIREFAEELRRLWSLGKCKNEIVIVLVTEDRLSSTSVGPGISAYISPQESRIFLDNKGYFTLGKYYEGLLSMVQAYYDLGQSIKLEKEEELVNTGLVSGIIVGILLLVVLIVLVGCTLRRRLSHSSSIRSIRKESWDGDPSHSWKKYQTCNTQDLDKMSGMKYGATENNNDQFISKRLQGEKDTDAGNETVEQNERLLTTVAELENDDSSSFKEQRDDDQDIQNTNGTGKYETELKYTEAEINLPGTRAAYRGTVTNL